MKRIGDDRCTVRDYIELAINLAIAYIIIISGVRVAMVIGPSMQPTLEDHSIHILVPIQDPEIGDIVAFRRPGQKNSYIKRIVAGPGDRVDHWGEMITLGDDEDCAQSAEQGFSCRKAKPEVGYRCNGVQPVWPKALPFPNRGSAQWLLG